MKKTTLFLLLAGILSLSSCKKDGAPDSGGTMLATVVQTSTTGTPISNAKYDYNAQNRIAEITRTFAASSIVYSEKYEYDAQDRLARITSSNTADGIILHYTFTYDGSNRIIRSTAVPILAGLAPEDYTFTYDSQNRIIADSTYDGTLLISYNIFTYNDKGNIVMTEQFTRSGSSFVSDGKVNVAYDDKPNPFRLAGNMLYFANPSFGYLSSNNFVSRTTPSGSAMINYEYYRNGLPRKHREPGISYEFAYFYK